MKWWKQVGILLLHAEIVYYYYFYLLFDQNNLKKWQMAVSVSFRYRMCCLQHILFPFLKDEI